MMRQQLTHAFFSISILGDVSILCSLAAVSFANWNESILCIFVLYALLLLIILNKKTRVPMSLWFNICAMLHK